MQADPFGNLRDWGPVLELVCRLSDEGKLSECQHGVTRILAYRDNWRLREETLKRIGTIQNPSDEMIGQVLKIIADEKLYYEVRILACETMEELMKNSYGKFAAEVETAILKTIEELLSMQHPPIFVPALKSLYPIALEKFSIV
ncbi:hypothetical protein [Desulfocastanea catecholica]